MEDITNIILPIIRKNNLFQAIYTLIIPFRAYYANSLWDYVDNIDNLIPEIQSTLIYVDNVTYEGWEPYYQNDIKHVIWGKHAWEANVILSGDCEQIKIPARDSYDFLMRVDERLEKGEKNLTAIFHYNGDRVSILNLTHDAGILKESRIARPARLELAYSVS